MEERERAKSIIVEILESTHMLEWDVLGKKGSIIDEYKKLIEEIKNLQYDNQ